MKNTHSKLSKLALLLLIIDSGIAYSQIESDDVDNFEFGPIEIVKGTKPIPEAKRLWQESEAYKESMAADKAASRAEREAMARDGYVTAPTESIASHDAYVNQSGKSRMEDLFGVLAYDPVADDIGYEVVGVIPDPPLEDGKIHDTTTVLDHPTLGRIFIRERSIATEPRSSSKYIYAPKFDLEVNGSPALLTVLRSEDRKSGRTVLSILTDTQLLHVSVGKAIMKEDGLYGDLMDVGARL